MSPVIPSNRVTTADSEGTRGAPIRTAGSAARCHRAPESAAGFASRHPQRRGFASFRRVSCSLLCTLVAGCLTPHAALERCESQLRRSEDRIAALEREKQRLSQELQRVRQINDTLYARVAGKDGRLLPERLDALYRVASVQILPLFSGVRDEDGRPGAETLYVTVVPRDENGGTVPVPGRVALEVRVPAEETSPAADAGPVSASSPATERWEYAIEQVRSLWVSRLFGSGFQFVERLGAPPHGSTIEVAVRFETPDGRVFTDRQAVRVHVAGSAFAGESGQPTNAVGNDHAAGRAHATPADSRAPHTSRSSSPSDGLPPAADTPNLSAPVSPAPSTQPAGSADPASRVRRGPEDPGIAHRGDDTTGRAPARGLRDAAASDSERSRTGRIIPSSAERPRPADNAPRQDTSDVWKARDIPVLR